MASLEIDLHEIEKPFFPMGDLQANKYPWIIKAMEDAGFDFKKKIRFEYDFNSSGMKGIYIEADNE